MESTKKTVRQAAFDSKEARRAAREGHANARSELEAAWRRGDDVGEGDPNHSMYNGGSDPRMLFGRHVADHIALQSRMSRVE
jgi:hypothetical protein